jgi:hypothetical protein
MIKECINNNIASQSEDYESNGQSQTQSTKRIFYWSAACVQGQSLNLFISPNFKVIESGLNIEIEKRIFYFIMILKKQKQRKRKLFFT